MPLHKSITSVSSEKCHSIIFKSICGNQNFHMILDIISNKSVAFI